MLSRATSLLALALLAGCAPAAVPGPPAVEPAAVEPATPDPPLAVQRSWRRVLIDAGHGGKDEGAIGVDGTLEKDVTLGVAREAARLLREAGFEVIETRTEDRTVELHSRSGRGNASGAGLFVSLHANSAVTPLARGIETYWMDLASDEAAMRLAERENRALALRGDLPELPDVDALVQDLSMGAVAQQSHALADAVHRELIEGLRRYYGADRIADRGVKTAPFWVLVDSEVPSILVEVGYVTHAEEEALLRTRAWHHQAAQALVRGLIAFAERAERSEPGGP